MRYLLEKFIADPNDSVSSLRLAVSKRLNLPSNTLRVDILSRHLRWNVQKKKMEIVYDLSVDTNEFIRDTTVRFLPELDTGRITEYKKKLPPVIVGAGFVGLSCALALARSGANPIVLERSEETMNSNKTLQNDDKTTSYGGFHGRNGAVFIHERNVLSEDMFQRLLRLGRIQPINKDKFIFLSPEDCVALTTNMVAEIRNLGGKVFFGCEWVGCDYFLGKLKSVRYIRRGVEERIKTKDLIFAIGALDQNTIDCLADAKIETETRKNVLGMIVEYPYGEFKSAFLKGARTNWPNFFMDERFKGKDGRAIRFSRPYWNGDIHSHGNLSANELRLALDGKGEGTVKFIISVEVPCKEAKLIVREDAVSPLFYMSLRKDRPTSVPVELVADFLTKREPWKLGRAKPSYKKGVFISNLHSFLDNSLSDCLQYGLVHVNRNYPLFSSSNGIIYGFLESAGSPMEIFHEGHYTNKKGIYVALDCQNMSLDLNRSLRAGTEVAEFLLENA